MAAPALAANAATQHTTPAQAGTSVAQDTPVATTGAVPTSTVNYNGVMVAIDPTTGRLREPTAAQRQQLAAAMRQQGVSTAHAGANVRPLNEEQARTTLKHRTTGPAGKSIQLPMSHISYLMVDRNADGSLDIHHEGDTKAQSAKAVTQ